MGGLFTDTITVYQKQENETYKITVVSGVQWSDTMDKIVSDGRLDVAKSANVTLPFPAYLAVNLERFTEEDAIFLGEVTDAVTDVRGGRLSDIMRAHPKSGIIRSVNDNTNRTLLKNVKVVVY